MKTISTTAIVALMTASIGLGAVAPALAQDAAAPAAPAAQSQNEPGQTPDRGFRNGPGMRHDGAMGGGLGLLGVDRGAEAVEIAIVRLSHAVDLTDAQKALLDTLKTDALAAVAQFETATEGLRPAAPAEGETATAPDISERFDNRIALETARLDALEAIRPAFTAFFDSLTDAQKAELAPARGDAAGKQQGGPGQRHGAFGPGQQDGQRPMGPDNR